MIVIKTLIRNSRQPLITHIIPGLSVIPVRYRKARDVPKAPSKLYNVREPTKRDPVETEMLMIEYNHYRSTVKSLHAKLREIGSLAYIRKDEASSSTGSHADTDESLREGLELNRLWNEEIAAARNDRMAREEALKSQMTNQQIQKSLSQFEKTQTEGQKVLSKMPKVYLTDLSEEQLDAEIDMLLDSPCVNYDFSATDVKKRRAGT